MLIKAVYEIESHDIEKAAHDIAYGQSIGNPDIRTPYDEKLEHVIPKWEIEGDRVTIFYPANNFGKYFHINYLMSVIMGGQMDIDHIKKCRLIDLDLSQVEHNFLKPKYGVEGIRKMIHAFNRPLVGGIVKPKIGLNPDQIAEVCKKMADGGVDFIKEDEILNFQEWCPMEERVEKVKKALDGYDVIYAPCVTSDDYRLPFNSSSVKAVHLNIWTSFGHINIMRKHFDLALFFQKSGDKVMTTGNYSIDFRVICKLVNLIGCDFAHVGMHGGYLSEPEDVIRDRIKELDTTIPSFSCGAKPDHVIELTQKFGQDIMITSGGYIHGSKKGITKATKEFRDQAEKAGRLQGRLVYRQL